MTHFLTGSYEAFDPPRWTGDPTLIGWGVFFAYFIGAWLCYRAATRVESRGQLASAWLGLASLLLLLGINKQLDLQLWLTAIGRSLSRTQGWYKERFYIQLAFTILVVIVVIVVCWFVLRMGRGHLGQNWLALVGTALLATFVVMRTVSYDVVDLSVSVFGMKLHQMIEAAGVLMVAAAAANFGRDSRSPSDTD